MIEANGSPEYIEFIAKIRNMNEETETFVAEQHKLRAEGDKFRCDRFFAPVTVFAAVIAGAVSATLPPLIKLWLGGHL